jgi:CheY-like chemotaxis protein
MFRILIVEDISDTLEQLRMFFSERFPDAKVDAVETVAEGLESIKEAMESGRPYHAAVLDFKLPQDKGESPKVDESLCLEIRNRMSKALVAHITAYPDDPMVLRHLKNVGLDYRDPRAIFISKLEVDWPDQLVRKVKAYLYGTRIEKQMDELFGTDEQRAAAKRGRFSRPFSGSMGGKSATHELAALFRDIAAHWDDLDERSQGRIQKMFYVNTQTDPIRVSLMKRAGGTDEE